MKTIRTDDSAANRDPIGGAPGKAAGEVFDPKVEAAYWEENHSREPYCQAGYSHDDYSPAYRTGFLRRSRFDGRRFEEVEHKLEAEYNRSKGASRLEWEHARHAARAAWERPDGA